MRISDWSSDVCSSDLVRRPAVAGALHAAGPLALDQPHVRPGLLVLADPAGVRRAFAGHRLRRQDASAGHDEPARQADGLAARAPAARGRVAGGPRARGVRLLVPATLSARLTPGCPAPRGTERGG